jgi:hypothetical protein
MQGTDNHKAGFLAGGILLGFVVGMVARSFGVHPAIAFGLTALCVGGSLLLAHFRTPPDRLPLTEQQRRQRTRSIAIALALAAFSALFYAATIIRLGKQVANRPY